MKNRLIVLLLLLVTILTPTSCSGEILVPGESGESTSGDAHRDPHETNVTSDDMPDATTDTTDSSDIPKSEESDITIDLGGSDDPIVSPPANRQNHISTIRITTHDGAPVMSKTYKTATVEVSGALYNKYNVTVDTQIRCRGNSSYSGNAAQDEYNSKNSFRLKLSKKLNLLGVGDAANKDWVLNANKFDASGLRNFATWELADQMGTLPFVPNCAWVQVYINGDYRGLYMLTELVEAAEGRVDVKDELTTPDKGYLVVLDFRGEYDSGVIEGLDYFYVPGFDAEFVIKSDVTSSEETDYIKDYILTCNAAILGGDREEIEALIDIPSLIDIFIIEELSKDPDAGSASFYMQKDRAGKLYFTAPWDFDFGYGTYGPARSKTGFCCENTNYTMNAWFHALIEQEWFLSELDARMEEVAPMIEKVSARIRDMESILGEAADLNADKWNLYGEKYHAYVSEEVSSDLENYGAHVEFLAEWIEDRWDWMVREIDSRL